jgi:hypothetical protein
MMSCATAIARHEADPAPTSVARGPHRPGPVRGVRAARAAAPVKASPATTIPVGAPAEASEGIGHHAYRGGEDVVEQEQC